ncbi:MAG: hypothetical protein AAGI37_07675 [Planctomycetota bacterium]
MNATADHRNRGVRVLGLSFAALFVLLCTMTTFIYLRWQGKPEHWEQEQLRIAALSEAQQEAISESLRNRLLTQWSDPGDKAPVTEADLFGQRRTIEIPYAELNTWIKAEGVGLLRAVGVEVPESTPTAMIDSHGDGLLRISFEVDREEIHQVITLSFMMSIAEDGTLTSTLERASAGRLPLPASAAIELVASQTERGDLLDLMRGNPVGPIEFPIDASKNGLRDGRLVGLEVREDALLITRETIRRNMTKP